MSFIKMSAKLIVHKFENESDYTSLSIFIENNGEISKITEWQEGVMRSKPLDKDKPRLVVKIITDEKFNLLDLDACAEKIGRSENFTNNILLSDCPLDLKLQHISDVKQNIANCEGRVHYSYNEDPISDIDKSTDVFKKYFRSSLESNCLDSMDPLEYSLERVKENNANIMENILILNRTLKYTKNRDMPNSKILGSYPCEECGKCFVYETGLRRHYAVRHAYFDSQPRWQLVWTCTECFQVWPQQDFALDHAKQCCKADSINCVREIKTSSLLQCEFCEKVFTSIPRLLAHLKLHNVTNNYECNACDVAFLCYKIAEQHWMTCMWLKLCYQFTLPKMLLCNACDRKFRSYDLLYNHRYKMAHFIPKTNDGNFTLTSMLVYQCEICGQWFNEVPQLLEHRHQFHPHCENGTLFNIDMPLATED